MADIYEGKATGLESPIIMLKAVAPSDTVDLADGRTRALFVGVAGSVVVRDALGNTVTLTSADSQYHPIRVVRVMATGTTASGIVALW